MGTDIHGVFQRRNPSTKAFEDVPSNYRQDRHYQLFAVLASVRNGYGFAGVPTGQAVKPISEPRGFPADFLVKDECHPTVSLDHMDPRRREWQNADDNLEVWMGDHSHSWLSGEELLGWWAHVPEVIKTGVLDRAVYETWDGTSTPQFYCGGVSGRQVIVINDNAVEKAAKSGWTHIRCTWTVQLSEELAYFFDEVKRLQDVHGEVRFVFGFDS